MHWQSQPFTLKCQFVVLNSLGPPGARNITENARSMMWSHQATGQEPLALRTPPQVSLTLTPPRASPIFSPGWESAGVAKSRSSCRSAQKDFQKNSLTTCFQCIHGRWPSWTHIHSDGQSGGFVNGVCFLMVHLFTCITGGGKVKLSYMIDTYLNHDQVSMLFLSTQQLRGRHKEKTLGFRILLDDFVYNFRRTCRADWTIFFWENLCYIDIYFWYTYLCLCLQTSTSIWHWTIPSSFNENEYRCQQIHPWQVTLQVVLHASAVAPTRINGDIWSRKWCGLGHDRNLAKAKETPNMTRLMVSLILMMKLTLRAALHNGNMMSTWSTNKFTLAVSTHSIRIPIREPHVPNNRPLDVTRWHAHMFDFVTFMTSYYIEKEKTIPQHT